jgi:hypothetical protein
MSRIIENLKRFNSKERYFLVNYATKGGFELSDEFRKKVSEALNLELPESPPFVAMDYHLDWLLASLALEQNPEWEFSEDKDPPIYNNKNKNIQATQEDIDSIIAFDKGEETHIVLLEVKGVTGWTNKQLNSKAVHLDKIDKILDSEEECYQGVFFHFAIFSPKKPTERLKLTKGPKWMKSKANDEVIWIKLPLGTKDLPLEIKDLWKVERCDKDRKRGKNGKWWTVKPR